MIGPVYSIGIITGIGAVIGWIVGAVADIAAAVAAALAAVWAAFLPILVPLWNALKAVWATVVQPAWGILKSWGEKIYELYQDHIQPIIDGLNKVAKLLRDVYTRFIQPFRDLLSATEQFLHLTHLDQTAFGQWLDGELHRVDTTIGTVWADITGPLNTILKLINEVILDARGLLQPVLLLRSTAAHMGTIIAQWWDGSLQTITTDWAQVIDQFHTGPSVAGAIKDTNNLIQGNPSPLTPWVDHGVTIFRLVASGDDTTLDYAALGVGSGGQES